MLNVIVQDHGEKSQAENIFNSQQTSSTVLLMFLIAFETVVHCSNFCFENGIILHFHMVRNKWPGNRVSLRKTQHRHDD